MRESYEDYLKTILLISKKNKGGWVSNYEISESLGIKPSSVTNMLYKLRKKSLINWSPRKPLRLTEKGKKIGEKTISKYNNLKEFFTNVLKIKDLELIEQLCCGIEHHITKEISKTLGNLTFDNTILLKN